MTGSSAVVYRGADRRRELSDLRGEGSLLTLRPGDIVVLEIGSHRSKAVRQLIRGADADSLRQTSTHLNPIEQVFAKLKHLIRKAAARTVDAGARNRRSSPASPRRSPTISKIQAIEPNFITL